MDCRRLLFRSSGPAGQSRLSASDAPHWQEQRHRQYAGTDQSSCQRNDLNGRIVHSVRHITWLAIPPPSVQRATRSEAHTSELQSLMRISYAVFCLKKKTIN